MEPGRFAERIGLEAGQAEELFARLSAIGMQTDGSGNIIGALIRMTVSPDGFAASEPPGAWMSVFLPGGSRETGPASPT